MSTILKTLVLSSSVIFWVASNASAVEFQCRKLDSSLRIAVEVKKAGHTLPCEVVAEDDRGDRAVLYSAQYDRDYCPSRIEKTKDELEQEGWSCQQTSTVNVVRGQTTSTDQVNQQASVEEDNTSGSGGALVTGNARTILASHQCRQGDDLRSIRIEAENSESGKPCELIYWQDGDQSKPGQLLWRAENDATFCPRRLEIIVGKWTSEGWRCAAEDTTTAALDASPALVADSEGEEDQAPSAETVAGISSNDVDGSTLDADPALAAVVTADAKRIGEWMEVDPDIEIAARGDLNDDGSDDAVVFLAYQSDQSAYRQYLMSYLVAGNGYELASVKLLTGVNPPPAQARVDEIDKGVIWLTLPDEDNTTPSQTGYRLRDQQLVEVDAKPEAEADD
ncbi:MAG: hypothetical protein AAF543_09500 [Pseudomonadota bacterium]